MKKILRYKDVMEELYEEFSEIKPEALDAIIKKGLYTAKSEFSKGEELLIHSASTNRAEGYIPGWIKFYRDMTPAKYNSYIKRRNKKRDADKNRTK